MKNAKQSKIAAMRVLVLQRGQRLFDCPRDFRRVGSDRRLEARDDLTVWSDQEFREVPLYVTAGLRIGRLLRQILIEQCVIENAFLAANDSHSAEEQAKHRRNE